MSFLYKVKDTELEDNKNLLNEIEDLQNQNEVKEKEILHLLALEQTLRQEISTLSKQIKSKNNEMKNIATKIESTQSLEKENVYLKYKLRQLEIFNNNFNSDDDYKNESFEAEDDDEEHLQIDHRKYNNLNNSKDMYRKKKK